MEKLRLPTDILAQAMVNSSKIKSYGYSRIKLGTIFSFAEKGKEWFVKQRAQSFFTESTKFL